MEQIAETRLLVDDIEFADNYFSNCLGYARSGNSKTIVTFKMPSGSRILVYDDNEIFRSGPTTVDIMVEKEHFEKSKTYMAEKKIAVGENSLMWILSNGSILNLELVS
jgi:hypothetical protein